LLFWGNNITKTFNRKQRIMYAKRNTITIAVLWLILTVIGIFWISNENKKIKVLQTKNGELRKKLDGSLEIIQALEVVENEYRILSERWNHAPKQIVAEEEPSFSLYYLNWLINNHKIPLEFDFELKNIAPSGHILTFSFLLSGQGSYNDLYRMIWFLTKNLLLYQIESFTLKQTKESDNIIDFSLSVKGFSLIEESKSAQKFNFDTMRPVAEQFQFHDAFKPLYRLRQPKKQTANMFQRSPGRVVAKPVKKGLIDIESATLQAVANGRIYIKDRSGKLHTLKVGDEVRNGRLKAINQKRSEVQFSVGGKTVTLGLGYKK